MKAADCHVPPLRLGGAHLHFDDGRVFRVNNVYSDYLNLTPKGQQYGGYSQSFETDGSGNVILPPQVVAVELL